MRNNKKKIYKTISLFILVTLMLSCSVRQERGNSTIETILQERIRQKEEPVKLKKLHTIQDIYPLDWFDEENILMKKENISKPKVDKGDGTKIHPNNLYKYNIKTGKESLLVASTEDIGFAVLSPDKRYVLYQENTDITATGYIYDIESKKGKRITDEEEMPAGIGRWLDNEKVIFFSAVKGGIYTVEVNGYRKQLVPANGLFMRDPVKVGDKVYFVTGQYKLYEYDIKANKLKNLLSDAAEFIPDNSGNRFAFVPLGRKSIDIRNEKGDKIMTIYDKGSVGGFKWSRDGKKLAYMAFLPNSNTENLFIAEMGLGKSELVPLNLTESFPIILWSPLEKRLLIPCYDIVNHVNKPFAVIIELE